MKKITQNEIEIIKITKKNIEFLKKILAKNIAEEEELREQYNNHIILNETYKNQIEHYEQILKQYEEPQLWK